MTIAKACQARLCVELLRNRRGPDELAGVVLDLSPQWCLLASMEDFDPDGYWIIRRDTIRRVRYRRFEAFRHRILTAHDTISRLRPPRGLDIASTDSLFVSLVNQHRYAILYRETEAEWWRWHSAILGLERGRVLLHLFDGAGCFETRIRRYRVADITCVRFGNRYLREFQSAAPYDYDNRCPANVA